MHTIDFTVEMLCKQFYYRWFYGRNVLQMILL